MPAGEYGFVELYCNEIDCDCRRVLIQVLSPSTGDRPWATISYGWESPDFYHEWGRDSLEERAGVYLDPINPQTKYSGKLLELFNYNVDNDQTYVERLKRHYAMFKKSLNEENQSTQSPSSAGLTRVENAQAAGASATRTLISNKTQQLAASRRANAISKAEKTRRRRMRKLNQRKRK